jgi:homoserine dehydrogenase
MKISLNGMGSVGREFTKQTIACPYYKFISIADTSCAIAKMGGFSASEMGNIIKLKQNGGKLKEYENPGASFLGHIEETFEIKKYKPDVLVDMSSAQTYPLLLEAIKYDINVVGSNKIPYAEVPYSDYEILFETAKKKRRIIDNRTTVSANLGVLTRVREFSRTAGGIDMIKGCLSGTMAYISWKINGDRKIPFSVALKDAKEKRYTEPHPRDDIMGEDSRRKAVIIGRTSDVPIEMSDVKVENIVPPELMSSSVDEFMEGIKKIDKEISRRIEDAKEKRCALRYLAELDFNNEIYEIGFKSVSIDDKLAKSTGTDNAISIYPRSWRRKSINIEGPGAGVDVTAQGVAASTDYVYEVLNF